MALTPIDFVGLTASLLQRADTLVPQWLSGGHFQGEKEYVCAGLSGGKGRSLSVNLKTGMWADFSAGEGGRDLVSLYAAIHDLSQIEAARELMGPEANVRASAPAAAPQAVKPVREDEGWVVQRPVPAFAPRATYRHIHYPPEAIEHVAAYRVGEALHGYVVRFKSESDGKVTLPYTWCTSSKKGGSRWHWKQFDELRPLYFPLGVMPKPGQTVLLVEGELKADVLQEFCDAAWPGVYFVASWAGGSNAWNKAEWSWLAGCTVLLWPDCDAKHEPLTAKERKETPDKLAQQVLLLAKPLLPRSQQPSTKAMLNIGHLLVDKHECSVQLLQIPEMGSVEDGWDCKDAIKQDGWTPERMLAHLGRAQPLPPLPEVEDKRRKAAASDPGIEPPKNRDPSAKAGTDDDEGDDDAFAEQIAWVCDQLKCKVHELGVNRKLVIAALQKSRGLKGVVGYNELTHQPCAVRPWPWRKEAGPLHDADDLRLGDWLSQEYKLKGAPRSALTEAIDTCADMNRFHPVRQWLGEQKWDGRPRLDKWLMHVLQKDPKDTPPKLQRYFALVGRYMLMGLVARVMDPGCKFDYSPVIEGKTGMGKSTLVKELVGKDYFSDTHFDIGNGKEGMEQVRGLWALELSEMTAFRRADSEQVKQFFSSSTDRFRGAYGRYVQAHPRQCVIICTTNKRQYLYDMTGNRRFWPFWVDKRILIAWVRKWRGQLFAEALQAYLAGERYSPTPEEEEAYFVPEQEKRLVETSVQSQLYELLTRCGGKLSEGKATEALNEHTTFVTIHQLVKALGSDVGKSNPGLEGQIRSWLDAYGWMAGRQTNGARLRGFSRPEVWPPKIADDDIPGFEPVDDLGDIKPETGQTPTQATEPEEGGDDMPW